MKWLWKHHRPIWWCFVLDHAGMNYEITCDEVLGKVGNYCTNCDIVYKTWFEKELSENWDKAMIDEPLALPQPVDLFQRIKTL